MTNATLRQRITREFGRMIAPKKITYASYDAVANSKLDTLLTQAIFNLPSGMDMFPATTGQFGKAFTLTNPGTVFTTVLDITTGGTGARMGYLLGLYTRREITTNNVGLVLRITIDGVATTTSTYNTGTNPASGSAVVGATEFPWFIPFRTSLKIELKLSGNSGNSADITGAYIYAYQ